MKIALTKTNWNSQFFLRRERYAIPVTRDAIRVACDGDTYSGLLLSGTVLPVEVNWPEAIAPSCFNLVTWKWA